MDMSWIDWCIVIIPMVLMLSVAFYSKRYARGVVDYLAAGRIAGRYVLAVGGLEGALSVITLVAGTEQNYQTGFSVGFWGAITAPVGMFLSLTGFCLYRWRETRCLSMGQFLELRYGSKFFRIFCAALRTIAEMVTNAIGPAIAANFFIYFLGLPHRISLWGHEFPTYGLIVLICLTLAIAFIWPSGRISLVITDCFQGLLSYPIFVIIVVYILCNFSWTNDIAPVMWNRVAGQSFMNPYDISQMRDFNLFALVVTLCGSVLNRAAWIGNDTSGAAKTAHEQKMSGILGAWRNGLSYMMILLIAILVICFMNSPHFYEKSHFKISSNQVRLMLSRKVLEEAMPNDAAKRERILKTVQAIPAQEKMVRENYQKTVGVSAEKLALARDPKHPERYLHLMKQALADKAAGKPLPIEVRDTVLQQPLSQQQNPDTAYLNAVRKELGDTPQARFQFQKFRSLYNQMMMPTVVGHIFPIGLMGVFCLLMIMLLISTDDSRIFNASATLMQDMVLPLYKGHLDQKTHLLLLRLLTVGVGVFFLIVSLFFAQLDYINMFTTIMCSLWLGGAGPIMTFGLYTRFGNLTGAWCAIIFGSGTSLAGLICQRNWALTIYPWLEKMGWVEGIGNVLYTLSSPFHPWIVWTMNPVKFPINSYEIYFISMILSIGSYVIGSCLTYKPYNLDKLLHRGEYADGQTLKPDPLTWRNLFSKIISITPEYTRTDRIITYSVFGYSFVWGVVILFGGIVTWNAIYPWPHEWWTIKFFITSILISLIIGTVSTVWFLIGGIKDSRQLFIDLAHRVEDPNDNGQVFEKEKAEHMAEKK